MKNKYEIIEIESAEVMVDVSLLTKTEDMFFNATLMAKKFGKKPDDWLRTSQAIGYIDLFSRRENMRNENIVQVKQGGKYQGTWMHKKLTLPFARWLSVEFEYELDRWIESKVEEERKRKSDRLDAKTGHRPMTDAILLAHDEPKHYHFSNEADLINKIVLGMTAKQFKELHGINDVRDSMDADEISHAKELQKINTSLIMLGQDYQQRKETLTNYKGLSYDGS